MIRYVGFIAWFAIVGLLFILPNERAKETTNSTPVPEPTRITHLVAPQTLNDVQLRMISNESCQLPCFWGFRPGETTGDEVLSFVQPIEDYNGRGDRYDVAYDFSIDHGEEPIVTLAFSIRNERLALLQVILRNSPYAVRRTGCN
jgi:hypothetical protein